MQPLCVTFKAAAKQYLLILRVFVFYVLRLKKNFHHTTRNVKYLKYTPLDAYLILFYKVTSCQGYIVNFFLIVVREKVYLSVTRHFIFIDELVNTSATRVQQNIVGGSIIPLLIHSNLFIIDFKIHCICSALVVKCSNFK